MTSNASPPPADGPNGRRRALGRGPGAGPLPGAPPVEPGPPTAEAWPEAAPPEPMAPAEPTEAEALAPAVEQVEPVEPVEVVAPAQPVEPVAPVEAGVVPAAAVAGSAAVVVEEPVVTGLRVPVGAEAESVEPVAGPETPVDAGDGVFKVRLANFEGPFDLLLQLISRHKLDVTEVALSKVTDEFMAYIRALGPDWDLDETTEFLVVAATLLDLKAARLLPAAEVEDEGDLALLEARDLLFARLLQYRAYKRIADIFSGRLEDEARRYPRTVGLEPQHAELLPEVVISIGAEGFAKLAVKAMQPRPRPQVYVDHIHAPLVSVQEQAQIVVARLRELGEVSFRALVEDTDDTLTVVARFLALLELYREKAVELEQEAALGELLVRWTGGDGDETPTVTDEFDRPPEPPKEEKPA
ncbi:segregation and condensation protein A [Streptomyces violarus]|uniref:Segregation and condensation protein A n=1 Tax=Streptomyces violarus TaxID=67380 RepID=A0A7W4ZWE0_9ACTN|nr:MULTISPECIES: segregation/condensation protein A [Streptomyces]MBB3079957.1 segregation and condensation protein A [Streptomyces violarus]WRU02216.1 segregation/condensation protein A [Streptomyces sp. CGMCC 4.1772]